MTMPADLRSAQRRLARRRLTELLALGRATDEREAGEDGSASTAHPATLPPGR